MTLIHVPPRDVVPIERPTFHEQCQGRTCAAVYIAGTPDPTLLRIWRLAHAKHWEVDDA